MHGIYVKGNFEGVRAPRRAVGTGHLGHGRERDKAIADAISRARNDDEEKNGRTRPSRSTERVQKKSFPRARERERREGGEGRGKRMPGKLCEMHSAKFASITHS